MKRGVKGYESIYVPTRHGGLVQRSTGTSIPAVVRGMKRMVTELRDRAMASGNWALLDAIYTKRLKLKQVYPHHVANTLAELEAKLSAKNLADHLDGWIAWVRAERRKDVETADVYWQQVTTLIDPGRPMPPNAKQIAHASTPFPSVDLTKERVMTWLTSRTKTSSGTKRKYLYALKSFVRYLMNAGVLSSDPLAGLKAPKKNRARERWETVDVDERIVVNALERYRAMFAFVKGTGCDVGAMQRAQIGDVNLFASRATIRGTKTDRRHVFAATIEPWAMPYIKAHLATRRHLGNHALLFETTRRKAPSNHHARLTKKLGIEDYTLKDARHSVGVRMRLAGKSFEEIAAQLGTSVYQAVTVYTKYRPDDVAAKEAKS
jgi:integrase